MFIYLLPYIVSFFISSSVAAYVWRRQTVAGARPFTWLASAQALWTFGFILELITPTLSGKLFWDGFQWLSGIVMPLIFPAFTIDYANYKIKRPRLFWSALAIFPLIFFALVLTSGFHQLLYPNPHLVPGEPFSSLEYDFTVLFWAFTIYGFAIIIGCMLILFQEFGHPFHLYRSQVVIIIVGASLPILVTFLPLIGINIAPQRDPTPFTFAIGNLIIGVGLFHYRLLDLVPIARDITFEHMNDLVVVLDAQDRIVDMNSAALANIDSTVSEVIGLPAKKVFAQWAEFVDQFHEVKEGHAEITVQVKAQTRHYDLEISPLRNRLGLRMGRVFIARDVTHHKEIDLFLERLNAELQLRIVERTEELAQAYDTTLEGWAKALELRDKETEGHSRRIVEMTVKLAQAMDFAEQELIHIRRGTILHDIGKMGIPDDVLRKGSSLTDEERVIVQKHPEIAFDLLRGIPFLEKAAEIPYCHHEKWDGTGYPRGLKDIAIPLSARIFAVVDVWDALTHDRPYRAAWQPAQATQYLRDQSGKQFDPKVVDVFLRLLDEGKI